MRALFALLAALTLLPACSSRDPLVARQKSYERLAAFIEPGMTRRQLYALLPPQRPATLGRTPQDFKPNPEWALIGNIQFMSGLKETYPLDRDFALNVSYTPKASQIEIPRTSALLNNHPRPRTKAQQLRDASLRALFFFGVSEPPPKPRPPKQNSDDEIYERPKIVRVHRGATTPAGLPTRPH